MTEFFKGDLTSFAQRGFIWSSEARFKINVPEANWTGTIYVGCLPMAEFLEKELTVGQLIAVSSLVQPFGT